MIAILCGLLGICLGALTTWMYWLTRAQKHRKRLRAFSDKAERLSKDYNHYRQRAGDLKDALDQAIKDEAEQRIVAQEWKLRYEDLMRQLDSLREHDQTKKSLSQSRNKHQENYPNSFTRELISLRFKLDSILSRLEEDPS